MEPEKLHQDRMRLIEEMIAEARYQPGRTEGMITLMWGYLVLVSALLHWFLETKANVAAAPAAWLLMLVGLLVTLVWDRKKRARAKVKTYVNRQISQLWLAFLVSFVFLFFGMGGQDQHFLPLVLLMYGWAMWMHGSLIRFDPYKYGGIACWLAAMVAFSLSPGQQLLVLAAAVVLGYIGPGHLLINRVSRQD